MTQQLHLYGPFLSSESLKDIDTLKKGIEKICKKVLKIQKISEVKKKYKDNYSSEGYYLEEELLGKKGEKIIVSHLLGVHLNLAFLDNDQEKIQTLTAHMARLGMGPTRIQERMWEVDLHVYPDLLLPEASLPDMKNALEKAKKKMQEFEQQTVEVADRIKTINFCENSSLKETNTYLYACALSNLTYQQQAEGLGSQDLDHCTKKEFFSKEFCLSLERGAEEGNLESIGLLLQTEMSDEIKSLKIIKHSNHRASYFMDRFQAKQYQHGLFGVEKDVSKAREIIKEHLIAY